MKKGIVLGIVFLFVMMSFTSISGIQIDKNIIIPSGRGNILYVGGSGPNNYSSIQDAINSASNTDTVFVYQLSSPYYENVIVNKSINLIGEDQDKTIIDGEYGNCIIRITEDNVNIKNFTIRNSGGFLGDSGIKIDSKNCCISNCIIYRTKTAILINQTINNEINRCVLYTNGRGILVKSSNDIIVSDTYLSHNSLGLDIQDSDKIIILGVYAKTNSYGLFIYNSSNVEIRKSAVYNNCDNQGGILLNNCQNIKIDNCNIYHNGKGIAIINCVNIDILKSNINTNTHTGINLYKNNQDIFIENCEIANNMNFAIIALKGNRVKLRNNNIYNSIFGLHSKSALINARRNWWGSIFGPALFDRGIKDRLFFLGGWTSFIPGRIFKNRRAGSNWQIDNNLFKVKINFSRYVEIELLGVDSDNDLVPDWWEEKWDYDPNIWDDHKNLDPDRDALSNIEECYTDQYGSNPNKKDIFLEIDWIEETYPIRPNRPSSEYVEEMKMLFENHNINLHIDVGNLDGGEEIPFVENFTHSDLLDMYWDYFLHNDLNYPRKGIFHYALICDFGLFGGFSFMGWDSFDSFQISVGKLRSVFSQYSREWLIITTILHELGHTLGLTVDDHRGIDNNVAAVTFTKQWWKFRNYKSSLNYRYVYEILDFSDGSNGRGDFNDWANLDFGLFKNTHFKLPKGYECT